MQRTRRSRFGCSWFPFRWLSSSVRRQVRFIFPLVPAFIAPELAASRSVILGVYGIFVAALEAFYRQIRCRRTRRWRQRRDRWLFRVLFVFHSHSFSPPCLSLVVRCMAPCCIATSIIVETNICPAGSAFNERDHCALAFDFHSFWFYPPTAPVYLNAPNIQRTGLRLGVCYRQHFLYVCHCVAASLCASITRSSTRFP